MDEEAAGVQRRSEEDDDVEAALVSRDNGTRISSPILFALRKVYFRRCPAVQKPSHDRLSSRDGDKRRLPDLPMGVHAHAQAVQNCANAVDDAAMPWHADLQADFSVATDQDRQRSTNEVKIKSVVARDETEESVRVCMKEALLVLRIVQAEIL